LPAVFLKQVNYFKNLYKRQTYTLKPLHAGYRLHHRGLTIVLRRCVHPDEEAIMHANSSLVIVVALSANDFARRIAGIGAERSTYLLTVLRELGRLKTQYLTLTRYKN